MLCSGVQAVASEEIRARVSPCLQCHGENGVSVLDGVPSLAGQPDLFVQWQLVFFRGGNLKSEIMGPIAAPLGDEEIQAIGSYFAALPPPQPPGEPDNDIELSKTGALLAARGHCSNCHGDDLGGQQAAARLADQREKYLLKALQDYKAGRRTGTGIAAMPEVVYPLTEDEMKALAHYLARLR